MEMIGIGSVLEEKSGFEKWVNNIRKNSKETKNPKYVILTKQNNIFRTNRVVPDYRYQILSQHTLKTNIQSLKEEEYLIPLENAYVPDEEMILLNMERHQFLQKYLVSVKIEFIGNLPSLENLPISINFTTSDNFFKKQFISNENIIPFDTILPFINNPRGAIYISDVPNLVTANNFIRVSIISATLFPNFLFNIRNEGYFLNNSPTETEIAQKNILREKKKSKEHKIEKILLKHFPKKITNIITNYLENHGGCNCHKIAHKPPQIDKTPESEKLCNFIGEQCLFPYKLFSIDKILKNNVEEKNNTAGLMCLVGVYHLENGTLTMQDYDYVIDNSNKIEQTFKLLEQGDNNYTINFYEITRDGDAITNLQLIIPQLGLSLHDLLERKMISCFLTEYVDILLSLYYINENTLGVKEISGENHLALISHQHNKMSIKIVINKGSGNAPDVQKIKIAYSCCYYNLEPRRACGSGVIQRPLVNFGEVIKATNNSIYLYNDPYKAYIRPEIIKKLLLHTFLPKTLCVIIAKYIY